VELRNVHDQMGNEVSPGPKVYATDGALYATLEEALAIYFGDESVRTDSRGRASVYLRIGRVTGTWFVKAVQGEYRDSLMFQALPGAAVALTALPADTAILAGTDYPLTVFEIDRQGNHLPNPAVGASAASTAPQVAVVNDLTVTTSSTGRASIDLTGPAGTGRVHVSVVPDAVLATGTVDQYHMPTVTPALLSADGAIKVPFDGVEGSCPAWLPDGDRVLFDGLRMITPGGASSQVSTGNPDLIAGCGRFSADGEWIYFDGRLSTEAETASQVWRVRSDGTGLEQITSPSQGSQAWSAAPSPDGSRIVFAAGDPGVGGTSSDFRVIGPADLIVHTIATGTQDTIKRGLFLSRVSWSPTGEWIAFTYFGGDDWYDYGSRARLHNDRVALVRPDGTDHPVLAVTSGAANPMIYGGESVTWSPDGEWLAAMSQYADLRIKLIDIATGENLPLNASTRGYAQPAWRP
jgi:WD40 repeat protein